MVTPATLVRKADIRRGYVLQCTGTSRICMVSAAARYTMHDGQGWQSKIVRPKRGILQLAVGSIFMFL